MPPNPEEKHHIMTTKPLAFFLLVSRDSLDMSGHLSFCSFKFLPKVGRNVAGTKKGQEGCFVVSVTLFSEWAQ